MLESSGAIRDRTRETLAPADIAIARLYRVLLRTISTAEKGEMPLGQGVDLSKVRGLHGLMSESCRWTQLVPDHATLRRDAPAPVEALTATL